MRILQIIDSLDAGGAERMAVNYANALSEKIEFSGIAVGRNEGSLKNKLYPEVSYIFLNKKGKFDVFAVFSLKRYVTKNKIEYLHAHSTSFFTGFLIKIMIPRIKLIWHDHYGDSEFLSNRPKLILKLIKFSFYRVIAVNEKLKNWSIEVLKCKRVRYLPNFPSIENKINNKTKLSGICGKRIICLANLRLQKNHFLLLKVAQKLKVSNPDWTFHLVGKDFLNDYSLEIKNLIISLNLTKNVFIYNSRQDIENILSQSDIAILTSSSEGLPLALLEYGLSKTPVIATNVGEIHAIIENNVNGFLISSNDDVGFYESILKLINNEELREYMGNKLFDLIKSSYSQENILNQYFDWVIDPEKK